jgi:thiol-disulfide isomerase/thioredoxin
MRILLLTALLFAQAAYALEVGDPAPPLEGVTWVKGEPATVGKGVAIVEFWATWCAPCRDSIPHLTKLQKAHPDIAMIGLSTEDEKTVRPFVENMGTQMDYHVGILGEDAAKAYMEGISGIPHAFLIGKDGTVVWSGHPMELDGVLADVLAGSFDAGKAKKLAALETELQALIQKAGGKDQDKVLEQAQAKVSEILAIDPLNESGLRMRLAIAKHVGDRSLYLSTLRALPRERLAANRANGYAWDLSTEEDLSLRDLELALSFIEPALAAEPENAAYLDTKARILHELGAWDQAIALEERAVELSPKEKSLSGTLDYFRRAAKARAALPTGSAPSKAPGPQIP